MLDARPYKSREEMEKGHLEPAGYRAVDFPAAQAHHIARLEATIDMLVNKAGDMMEGYIEGFDATGDEIDEVTVLLAAWRKP